MRSGSKPAGSIHGGKSLIWNRTFSKSVSGSFWLSTRSSVAEVSIALKPSRKRHCFTSQLIAPTVAPMSRARSEEHTSELQSLRHLVCRLLLEKKNKITDV